MMILIGRHALTSPTTRPTAEAEVQTADQNGKRKFFPHCTKSVGSEVAVAPILGRTLKNFLEPLSVIVSVAIYLTRAKQRLSAEALECHVGLHGFEISTQKCKVPVIAKIKILVCLGVQAWH